MSDSERIEVERETARCWAVRLEGMLARAIEAQRSAAVLGSRAEADRDAALQRLSSCAAENAAYCHQLETAVAARDEAVTALTALVAALDDEVTCDSADERAARTLVARYRPAPAPPMIERP